MQLNFESSLLFVVSMGLWRAVSKKLLLDVHADSKASSNAATMLNGDVHDTTMLGRIKTQGRRNALSAEESSMILEWLVSEVSFER